MGSRNTDVESAGTEVPAPQKQAELEEFEPELQSAWVRALDVEPELQFRRSVMWSRNFSSGESSSSGSGPAQ